MSSCNIPHYTTLICNTCPLVKAYKLPFVSCHEPNKATFESCHEHNKADFDMLYIDLWHSPILSKVGIRYFFLKVDDFSCYMWIFFSHTKDEVQSIFFTFYEND